MKLVALTKVGRPFARADLLNSLWRMNENGITCSALPLLTVTDAVEPSAFDGTTVPYEIRNHDNEPVIRGTLEFAPDTAMKFEPNERIPLESFNIKLLER